MKNRENQLLEHEFRVQEALRRAKEAYEANSKDKDVHTGILNKTVSVLGESSSSDERSKKTSQR